MSGFPSMAQAHVTSDSYGSTSEGIVEVGPYKGTEPLIHRSPDLHRASVQCVVYNALLCDILLARYCVLW